MSLAFALLAAFNGSTGSCATLSHGLELRHQASPRRQPGGRSIFIPHGRRRKPSRTLSHKATGSPGSCAFDARWPFSNWSFESRSSRPSRLRGSQEVSENRGCGIRITAFVCATASARSGSLTATSAAVREFCYFVDPVARRDSAETSASVRPLAVSLQAPRTGFGEYEGTRSLGRDTCNAATAVLSDDAAATPVRSDAAHRWTAASTPAFAVSCEPVGSL